MEDAQPGVTIEDVFPEIGHGVFAIAARRVSGASLAPLIERQEKGILASELRRHPDHAVGHREVHHRATLESQQRFLAFRARIDRKPVFAILLLGRFRRLDKIGLQLDRGDRQSVDEENEVDLVIRAVVISKLRNDAQPVRRIACYHILIALILGRSLADIYVATAGNVETAAQDLDGSELLQSLIEPVLQHLERAVGV